MKKHTVMTVGQATLELADALRYAAKEHGRPNSFSCGELRVLYGGPPATMAGRVGRNDGARYSLWQRLGGHEKWGSCPTYGGGRFYV